MYYPALFIIHLKSVITNPNLKYCCPLPLSLRCTIFWLYSLYIPSHSCILCLSLKHFKASNLTNISYVLYRKLLCIKSRYIPYIYSLFAVQCKHTKLFIKPSRESDHVKHFIKKRTTYFIL